jgi:hypothetical protein
MLGCGRIWRGVEAERFVPFRRAAVRERSIIKRRSLARQHQQLLLTPTSTRESGCKYVDRYTYRRGASRGELGRVGITRSEDGPVMVHAVRDES